MPIFLPSYLPTHALTTVNNTPDDPALSTHPWGGFVGGTGRFRRIRPRIPQTHESALELLPQSAIVRNSTRASRRSPAW